MRLGPGTQLTNNDITIYFLILGGGIMLVVYEQVSMWLRNKGI